jgi:L-ascorbate metabolism protein UlaG (beta-lactamase superfamily)
MTALAAAALAGAVAAAPGAAATRIEVGPLAYEISISRTAELFYLVDQISAWSPATHHPYARWAQTALPPDELEERFLARHRELRKHHGWGMGLEQAFLTTLGLDAAADAAVKGGLLTQEDAREEVAVLQHFAPRLQPFLETETPKLEAFRQRLVRELPDRADSIQKLARFVEFSGAQTVPTFLMPDPAPDAAGGGFNGGALAVEVATRADAMNTLLHESFHVLLDARRKDLERAAGQTPGLDKVTLAEALAHAFMPGLVHDWGDDRDVLAEEVAADRAADKPWTDAGARYRALGLYLRDPLRRALTDGTTLTAFLPRATRAFRELAPLTLQRGLSLSPLDLKWLGTAGWQLSNGRTVVLVDPFVSRKVLPHSTASWEEWTDAASAGADATLTPDAHAIDARIEKAHLILVTHSHPDHLLDAPAIARKTGAVIVGSESTANVARANGVAPSHIVTVRGGEDLAFEGVSVRVVPSLHSWLARSYFDGRTIPRGIKAPLRAKDYVEGGTFAYLVRLDGHSIYINGTMNFIERELEGLAPDIAIVGAGAPRRRVPAYTLRLLRALDYPTLVLPNHVDDEALSVDQADKDERVLSDVKEFEEEVQAVAPGTRVVAPKHFEAIHVGD